MENGLEIGQGERVVGVVDPLLEAVVEAFAVGGGVGVPGEVGLLVGVFVEVEEHHGLAFERDILPAVSGEQAAPGEVDAGRVPGGDDALEVGGVGRRVEVAAGLAER